MAGLGRTRGRRPGPDRRSGSGGGRRNLAGGGACGEQSDRGSEHNGSELDHAQSLSCDDHDDPGGCSATSGTRGSTGACSTLPTSSAAACSPSALPKYTVVAVTSGSVRLPVSVTFQSASRSRAAVRSAAPATSEMLNTRTSALATGAWLLVGAAETVVVATVGTEVPSSLASSPEPMAWKATRRNTTTEEQQHHDNGAQR